MSRKRQKQMKGQMSSNRQKQANGLQKEPNLLDSQDGGLLKTADSCYWCIKGAGMLVAFLVNYGWDSDPCHD